LAQSSPTTPDLTEPRDNPAEPIDWNASQMLPTSNVSRSMSNDINDLPVNSRSSALNSTAAASDPIAYDTIGRDVPGRSENGAPAMAVTGTPNSGARSGLLAQERARSDVLGPIQRSAVSERIQRREPSAIPPLKKKRVLAKRKRVPAAGGGPLPRRKKQVPASRGLDRSPPKAGEGPVPKRGKKIPSAKDLF
jgi:hypothetical protein